MQTSTGQAPLAGADLRNWVVKVRLIPAPNPLRTLELPLVLPVAPGLLVWLALVLAFALPAAAAHLELADGDHVVLLGSTLIEREQTYGYWEAMLTSHFPTRNVIFRNLGWSGDTVWGESRAGFGTAADGYKALVEHVEALRPTVIIVGYGTVESFAGEPGLPRFIAGLNTLLDSLRRTKARIVILAPLKLEKLPAPLPDPQREDKNVWHYIDALHEVAVKRDDLFLDLNRWLEPLRKSTGRQLRLTDDTMHLTEVGYWMTAGALENDLQLRPAGWAIELDKSGRSLHTSGGRLADSGSRDGKLHFAFTSSTLPITAALRQPGRSGVVRIEGLPAGQFALAVDGEQVATASARVGPGPGGRLPRGAEADRAVAAGHRSEERTVLPSLAAAEPDLSVRLPQTRAGAERPRDRAVRSADRRPRAADCQTARPRGAPL